MKLTVTLEGVHCFATEDDLPSEDEFYIQHRILDIRAKTQKARKRTNLGKFSPGKSTTPGMVLIDRANFTPGRSYLELLAWDEDGISKDTMDRFMAGAIAARNPVGGLIMLGIFSLVGGLDPDDYIDGMLRRLDEPPLVVHEGRIEIHPMFAGGIVETFRAYRNGGDYLLVYRIAYCL